MENTVQKRLLNTLVNLERKRLSAFHIVMLPDFFVDHFVSFQTVEETCTTVRRIASQGGGNIPGISQQIHQGGNAANTALCLARLGMSSHLICRTNTLGSHLLQFFLGKHGVDLSGVKIDGTLAITNAFEFHDPPANVMIGDPGSVASFSFESLDAHDRELIAHADLVGVTNWNLNNYGTMLAYHVLEFAKQNHVKTFFDSGDPSPRITDIPDMMNKVLMSSHLDIFSLNENELCHYSNRPAVTQADMIDAAKLLKQKVLARIDLHTSRFSGSIGNTTTIIATIPDLQVIRTTGAGDAWNAANIFGELLEFPNDERLLFSNILAGIYISSSEALHPTIDMIIDFIKKTL